MMINDLLLYYFLTWTFWRYFLGKATFLYRLTCLSRIMKGGNPNLKLVGSERSLRSAPIVTAYHDDPPTPFPLPNSDLLDE